MFSPTERKQMILGLSYYYHDSAAVLLEGSEIIAAAQEERFTRRKFDNRFPANAIRFCLEEAHIRQEDIRLIAFYEEPYIKLDRIIKSQISFSPSNFVKNTKRIKRWLDDKFFIEDDIHHYLPYFEGRIVCFLHHLSHAASAFYPSPSQEAAILTVYGVSEVFSIGMLLPLLSQLTGSSL